jgi:hypothetical protein
MSTEQEITKKHLAKEKLVNRLAKSIQQEIIDDWPTGGAPKKKCCGNLPIYCNAKCINRVPESGAHSGKRREHD